MLLTEAQKCLCTQQQPAKRMEERYSGLDLCFTDRHALDVDTERDPFLARVVQDLDQDLHSHTGDYLGYSRSAEPSLDDRLLR